MATNIQKVIMLVWLAALSVVQAATAITPNVIVFTVDDMGSNDIGYYQGSGGDIRTPFLDQYAAVSTKLNNYYAMPNGHSSRTALLTGRHPAVLGTQFPVDDYTRKYGLDLKTKLLPEILGTLGYVSHAVGQWDLGFYSDGHLPTSRGFKSFYGSYTSYGNYTTHWAYDEAGHNGHDLHRNEVKAYDKTFKTELYAREAQNKILNHDTKEPLFLYLGLQAAQMREELCGSGSSKMMPNDYLRPVGHISDNKRRCYAALLKAVDMAFGRIVETLQKQGMLQNSIIVFTTTSGGPAAGPDFNAASNSPLRGSKKTGWEGGIRAIGFIYSAFTPFKDTRTSECRVHVTDWVPTILGMIARIANEDIEKYSNEFELLELYGKDQTGCIFNGQSNARKCTVHFLFENSAAIQCGSLKMLLDKSGHLNLLKMNEWYNRQPSTHISCASERRQFTCIPNQDPCIYNIDMDPCEKYNLAPTHERQIVEFLQELQRFNSSVNYDPFPPADIAGDPEGVVWMPWIQSSSPVTVVQLWLLLLTTLVTLLHTLQA